MPALHEVQPKPWHEQYPKHVLREIDVHRYKSLVTLLEQSIKEFGPLPVFDCMRESITFNELDELTKNFAAYLQYDLGLRQGTRVAIQLPNLLQYPIAMLGALRAGMVVVNVNPMYTAREMKHQLADSGAEAIVILANYAHNLDEILSKTYIKHIIITQVGDRLSGLKRLIVNGLIRYVKKNVPSYKMPLAVPFNDALKKGRKHFFKHVEPKGEDTAFLQYTGGTTGISKGAVLSHKNLVANVEQLSAWLSVRLNPGEEVVATPLPLYHIYALSNCFTLMKLGARNVLISDPRDMKGLIKELAKYPFTVIAGINTVYNSIMDHSDFYKIDFSHLKVASAGGMELQTGVAKRWKNKTGVAIVEGYGLTETSPVLTCNIPVPGRERLGTIGLPLPSTQIMIANDNEEEMPIGVAGEIYAKGPQVMKTYWNQTTETENVFTRDGWFKTGDIGVMDANGFIKIIDRKKEMITVSGFNVYPSEVEDVISSHPKVMEVGAIGVPDDQSTEVIKVFVVKKDQSLTRAELLTYCKKNLTGYKVPKYIVFRDELPKTSIGKVLRRLLQEVNIKTP